MIKEQEQALIKILSSCTGTLDQRLDKVTLQVTDNNNKLKKICKKKDLKPTLEVFLNMYEVKLNKVEKALKLKKVWKIERSNRLEKGMAGQPQTSWEAERSGRPKSWRQNPNWWTRWIRKREMKRNRRIAYGNIFESPRIRKCEHLKSNYCSESKSFNETCNCSKISHLQR